MINDESVRKFITDFEFRTSGASRNSSASSDSLKSILEKINSSIPSDTRDTSNEITKAKHLTTKYTKRSISKFKLMPGESSIPLIVSVDRSRDILFTANIDVVSAPHTGLLSMGRGLEAYNKGGKLFKNFALSPQTIFMINNKRFKNGINLGNFSVINIDRQYNHSIEHILDSGYILPLSSTEGIYIPLNIDFSLLIGIEQEMAFISSTMRGRYSSNFKLFLSDLLGFWEFQPFDLIQVGIELQNSSEGQSATRGNIQHGVEYWHAMDSENSHGRVLYAHIDHSADDSNYHGIELSIGITTIHNMIFFTSLINDFFKAKNMVYEVPPSNYGLHINIGMPHAHFESLSSITNLDSAFSLYGTIYGSLFNRAFRTSVRESVTNYVKEIEMNTTSPRLYDGRNLFRFDDIKKRLGVFEIRFPHNVISTQYTANQIIIAAKMVGDVLILKDSLPHHERMRMPSITKNQSMDNRIRHMNASNIVDIMDCIGFKSQISKSFINSFYTYCKSARSVTPLSRIRR